MSRTSVVPLTLTFQRTIFSTEYGSLRLLCRNWKISTKDRFGILLVSCADATGNVSIMSEE